ncbi:polysaccharide deacetylase family protein [Taylorella equigenitalis]|uniref:polysaccharide deacetylase family protein n=1 Tax=Taylorella equigenitalis TaxID=29575 RepID=UPI000429E043|nr:polysaccharide deacetylase family protein [Taylorella equigenitalis]ASY41186.1 polysaccharide deacetylase [Taylorella equigenitalis]
MRKAKVIPVLRYTHVTPNGGEENCPPRIFAKQMCYLKKRGFNTISSKEFANFIKGATLPRKSIMITFDHGFLDNYVYAYPILEKFKTKANFFVYTGLIRDGNIRTHYRSDEILPYCPPNAKCKAIINSGHPENVMMNWNELTFLRDSGLISIESNGHSATRWDQQLNTDGRLSMLEKELELSNSVLKNNLGINCEHLAWPNGYFEPLYLEVAKKKGFKYFYTENAEGVNTTDISCDTIYRITPNYRTFTGFVVHIWLVRHPRLLKLLKKIGLYNFFFPPDVHFEPQETIDIID